MNKSVFFTILKNVGLLVLFYAVVYTYAGFDSDYFQSKNGVNKILDKEFNNSYITFRHPHRGKIMDEGRGTNNFWHVCYTRRGYGFYRKIIIDAAPIIYNPQNLTEDFKQRVFSNHLDDLRQQLLRQRAIAYVDSVATETTIGNWPAQQIDYRSYGGRRGRKIYGTIKVAITDQGSLVISEMAYRTNVDLRILEAIEASLSFPPESAHPRPKLNYRKHKSVKIKTKTTIKKEYQ